jgi:alkylation response protein AidB-like acyl-CoA dehydrogenase
VVTAIAAPPLGGENVSRALAIERPTTPPSAAEAVRLLVAVDEIAQTLAAGASRSDAEGRLVSETVRSLRSRGFWRMRLCDELGGMELSMVEQLRVLAALAAADTSSAWCTMVANNAVAVIGATMPDSTVSRVFADGIPACSIVAAPGGRATRADGAYVLNGTWRVASSIHHADWIHATAHVDGDPSRLLPIVIPAKDVQLVNSWQVIGLGGTGSNDFTLTDYALDEDLAGDEHHPYGQLRGTRRYDVLGHEPIESYEHLAFAIGVARRALRELRKALARPAPARRTADREVVQSELARAMIKLQSIEATAFSVYGQIDAAAGGDPDELSLLHVGVPRALAALGTELAVESVQLAFRRAGLAALRSPSILDKLMRDMNVAASHVLVDDTAFASYGERLVRADDPEPTAGALTHAR